MKKLFGILMTVVLVSAFAGTLYYLYGKSQTKPVVWRTESPTVRDIVKKTVATGSVVPRKEVAIKPQVSGIIEELFVEPGKLIRTGDLVARIRIIPDLVSLNSAESRVNRGRLTLADAFRELERQRRLFEELIVPERELEQARLAHDTAVEDLESAIESVQLIREGTSKKAGSTTNTLVRATIPGTVLEVPVEVGNSVIEANTFNDGTTIATVADMNELIFEGKVDESEVGKIRPGMDLLLTVGAIEGQRFDAVLEHIAPKGVEENGAIQFEIRAALSSQSDALIRANLSANADVVLDRRQGVLAIDEGLLQFDGTAPYVEVETGPQTFERRTIETGLSDGIAIEVVSGLTAEDKIKIPTNAEPTVTGGRS